MTHKKFLDEDYSLGTVAAARALYDVWSENGTCKLLLREDGEHLPSIDLRATIFAIERL